MLMEHNTPTRTAGALRGAALASIPGLALALLLEWNNPAFVDEPVVVWLVLIAIPGLLGASVGALFPRQPDRWSASALLTSAAILFGVSLDDGVRPVGELQLLVFGLDGATWDIIDPQVAEGELPALAHLRADAATGTLRAHEPMFSPLLWTTLATGMPPERHGIRGFRVSATDLLQPRFYDIAAYEGRSIGIYKWLVSWPPRPLPEGSFIVPAWLAPSPETTPSSLSFVKEIELSRRLHRQRYAARRSTVALAWDGMWHGLRASTLREAVTWYLRERLTHPDADDRLWRLQLLRVQMDRDVFMYQMRRDRPQVATFTDYAVDALGHRFWREHQPEAFSDVDPARVARYGDAIASAYRQGDAVLGELQRLLPEDGRLVVLSDHGFQAVRDTSRVGPRTDRLEAELGTHVGDGIQIARMGNKITVMARDAEQRSATVAWLSTLRRTDTGAPLFRLSGVPDAPTAVALDLVDGSASDEALSTASVGGIPLSEWLRPFEGMTGEHAALGVFAAAGPGVSSGRLTLDNLDATPILLAALGLPASEEMGGTVPDLLWDAPPRIPTWVHALPATEPPVDAQVNEEMLDALGYLDR